MWVAEGAGITPVAPPIDKIPYHGRQRLDQGDFLGNRREFPRCQPSLICVTHVEENGAKTESARSSQCSGGSWWAQQANAQNMIKAVLRTSRLWRFGVILKLLTSRARDLNRMSWQFITLLSNVFAGSNRPHNDWRKCDLVVHDSYSPIFFVWEERWSLMSFLRICSFFKTHNNIVSITGLSNQWKKKQSFLGGNGAIAKLFVKPV